MKTDKLVPSTYSFEYIRDKILKIMVTNIGKDNGISREALFSSLFGGRTMNVFQAAFFWNRVPRVLTQMRKACLKNPYPFITSHTTKKGTQYFVVRNTTDAMVYRDKVAKQKLGMEKMDKVLNKYVERSRWKNYYQEMTKKN